jgi:hypothetical protein
VRRRSLAIAGSAAALVAVVGAATVPAQTGCSTRQCVGGFYTWEQSQGGWADPDTKRTWVTFLNPNDPWIPYGGNVQVRINFEDTGRIPINATVFVGVTDDGGGSPNVPPPPGDTFFPTFAQAAGELAVMVHWETDAIAVKNATCGDYIMYAIIEFGDRFPCTPGGNIEVASCHADGTPFVEDAGPSAPDASGDGGEGGADAAISVDAESDASDAARE